MLIFETKEQLYNIIRDLCDGIYTVEDLMNHTGLPEKRCTEIIDLLYKQ